MRRRAGVAATITRLVPPVHVHPLQALDAPDHAPDQGVRHELLQELVADKVYTSLLPAMSENGLATDKGLKVMVETLGTAVGKNVVFPPERLVDDTLLKEVQKEMGIL